jgi:zinc protease
MIAPVPAIERMAVPPYEEEEVAMSAIVRTSLSTPPAAGSPAKPARPANVRGSLRTRWIAALAVAVGVLSFALPAVPAAEEGASSKRADGPAWPYQSSDLKPDGKAVFGRLKNGLRYVILPNAHPPGRASLRLYINAGSLMEADDQQGMAHFLEHMAFNGTRLFPADEQLKLAQRLGMAFGRDTNAFTSFDRTVYKLDLPKTDKGLVTLGLTLFREYLDGMLLEPEQIERERGVIQSEKLTRDSVAARRTVASLDFALPDGRLVQRLPIGQEATVKSMQRPRFVDFYETFYSPERAVVVAVGDFKNVKELEGRITRTFGSLKARRASALDPDLGTVPTGRGLVARLHTETEAPLLTIKVNTAVPAKKMPDSRARRREKLVRLLADSMLNLRLVKLVKAADAPVAACTSSCEYLLGFAELSSIEAQCPAGQWKPALAFVEQELRRALKFGFTASEFAQAQALVLGELRQSAAQAGTRHSGTLADEMVSALAEREVFTHPADDLARLEPVLRNLNKTECLEALRAAWSTPDVNLFVSGNLKLSGDAAAALTAVYRESRSRPVTAPADEGTVAFAYTSFGTPGKIAHRSEVKDLEITQVVFDNNVRLNLKKTPFQKNSVLVRINFGSGKLEAPADKPGLSALAEVGFVAGGLAKHSLDQINRLFAGRTLDVELAVGEDAFVLSGQTTPADLEAQLRLLTAYLVAPGYRPEAERQLRQTLGALYTHLEHTDEGVLKNQVVPFIASGDARYGYPPRQVLAKRTFAEVRQWLARPLSDSYLEVSLVGDLDVSQALAAVSRTLGALPRRADAKPDFAQRRRIQFPSGPRVKDFRFMSKIPRAVLVVCWPTADVSDVQRSRGLDMLSKVLENRLLAKVRQELGATYSPRASNTSSAVYPGYGYLSARVDAKPSDVARIGELVVKIGSDLSAGPISDDEFERARKPILTGIEQQVGSNAFWLAALSNCQEHPTRLEWPRSFLAGYRALGKEDLQRLAREYLRADRAIAVHVVPQSAAPDRPVGVGAGADQKSGAAP